MVAHGSPPLWDLAVVFKGPVLSGLLTILGLNQDRDQS